MSKSYASYVLSTLLLAGTYLHAAEPAPAGEGKPHHKEESTPLGEQMEQIGDNLKKLRKQISDSAQNASSLELLAKIRLAAGKAAEFKPLHTQDIPEADRAKFVADYKAEMKKLDDAFAKLESALKANDNAGAEATLKEIGDLRKAGHKQFQRPKP